jgi:HEXXH motif-containing protein
VSHQYYYVATRLGPVDDGSDPTLYYSPIKRTGRPIANILLAYHAFGNVVLLMRDLRLNGYADETGYISANESALGAQLQELEAGLMSTTALTSVGRSLYDPLTARLHDGNR